ncbi:hypothetical protein CDSM653_00634 [Caldanaerobacter subterraneus subsp. pacificus DSM 12653]|uniref:Uncharacterized protein n=1 Tax=Caldanaerobacter subterraneus subsp. pacificus DSM 12653 TaxID=391606 RepID=A0A0F5PNX3_9THEO|nr:hypothetical protein CDSM653_00634 [Caldanaerobacter subterraneus subsp. pacificus DSM 12653]
MEFQIPGALITFTNIFDFPNELTKGCVSLF